MKALLASALTALVLVTAAWASNVTPAQLNALSARVTKLEHEQATMTRALAFAQKDNARVGTRAHALDLRLGDAEAQLADDEAYWQRCSGELAPVRVYSETIDLQSGASIAFAHWSPPNAGDPAQFWVSGTSDSSCLAPK